MGGNVLGGIQTVDHQNRIRNEVMKGRAIEDNKGHGLKRNAIILQKRERRERRHDNLF